MRFGKAMTGLVLGALVFAASASVMAQKVTKTTPGKGAARTIRWSSRSTAPS